MQSRLFDGPGCSVIGGLMLVLAAAGLGGCASTQTASLAASSKQAPFLERTVSFLRGTRGPGELTQAEADTVMALAIAEHEMRRP